MPGLSRELEWAALMQAALAGDGQAYSRLLRAISPYLGVVARRLVWRFGSVVEAEDVVQETLLGIHAKRQTWDSTRPLVPWISVIARHKTIDLMRRRGFHIHVPIEDFLDVLAAGPTPGEMDARDLGVMLASLKARQRDVVQAISLDGTSVRQTADRLQMSEGAVRVTLHRALRALAQANR